MKQQLINLLGVIILSFGIVYLEFYNALIIGTPMLLLGLLIVTSNLIMVIKKEK